MCLLLLALYVIEFFALCIIVPKAKVMSAVLLATYLFTVTVLGTLKKYEKEQYPETQQIEEAASAPVAGFVFICRILSMVIRYQLVDIKSAPYFSDSLIFLFLAFWRTAIRLSTRWKAFRAEG